MQGVGWRTRLVLVFPLDLQNVKEVGRCRMHLDEILARSWLRVRQLGHFELVRALQVLAQLNT